MNPGILIVDDEVNITTSLKRFFELNDYKVMVTNSPLDAIRIVEEENIQVVITDIMMPEMSGIELLKKIKEFNGGIQVIVITGVVSIDNVLTCLRAGAQDCFLKPLKTLDDLRSAVDRAIETLDRWEKLLGSMVKSKRS